MQSLRHDHEASDGPANRARGRCYVKGRRRFTTAIAVVQRQGREVRDDHVDGALFAAMILFTQPRRSRRSPQIYSVGADGET